VHQKKFENPAKLFDPSENPLVFVQTDTCNTCVRFGKCVKPSVITSVMDVGTAVGICTDGHVSYMRALRDMRNLLVLYVGKSVGEGGTIP
jgi:hypothetical protein